jgi:hypothetical protein
MHIALVATKNIFHEQNVGIPFENCSTKSWDLAQNEATKSTYNQTNAP